MLNRIWSFLLILALLTGILSGNGDDLTGCILDSTKEAVNLCLTMLGIIGLWTGLMEIAHSLGILSKISDRLQRPLSFLFPSIPKDHPAMEHITANLIANVLGLGWAATPAGLKAMKELAGLNHYSSTASDDMCTFLILNISSLQIIPITVITYRNQYGSPHPAAIIVPGLIATLISTLFAIIFCILVKGRSKL
ncbi:MAG: nucleoside recognition protein [Lachnospiraceae bacterium]|nr:nucleoside recognition protein [Lachnospiraceae bacterium]